MFLQGPTMNNLTLKLIVSIRHEQSRTLLLVYDVSMRESRRWRSKIFTALTRSWSNSEQLWWNWKRAWQSISHSSFERLTVDLAHVKLLYKLGLYESIIFEFAFYTSVDYSRPSYLDLEYIVSW